MPINVRVYASLVVFLILLAAPSAVAAKYAGGSGTMLDPYQIAAADDLVALGETPDDYDKHFVLISDIDLDPNRPGGRMFDRAVIAPNATDALSYSHGQAFAGQLDGRGHIIRNLCIEAPDSNGVGLVGCVAEGGLITRLGLEQIVVQGRNVVGGMVGENHGRVTCSYLLGDVAGRDTVGGVVGRNTGRMVDCYSISVVQGILDVGGLAGDHDGGLIANCYTAATSHRVDGRNVELVGRKKGKLSHCYYRGDAESAPFIYKGTALSDHLLRRRTSFDGWDSYPNTGDGCDDHWYFVEGQYPILSWQSEITGLHLIRPVVGLTREEAEQMIEDAGLIVWSVYQDYHHERALGEVVSTYPRHYVPAGDIVDLHISLGPYDWSHNAGDGSESNPFRIDSLGQLESLREHEELRDKHFLLVADIELNRESYAHPIIPWSLRGVFDGGGHKLDRFSGMNTCLFDSLEDRAVVSHLTFTHVALAQSNGILARDNAGYVGSCFLPRGSLLAGEGTVGGLVGANSGIISRCDSRTSIIGTGSVQGLGALVGVNHGTVVQCRAEDGVLSGVETVRGLGGLVGENLGQVTESFTQGADIKAGYDTAGAGGLVGINRGLIADCWSHTGVQASLGARDIGGVVGENFDTVRNCHADCWMVSCTSATRVGEFIGANHGSITSCYFQARWFNNGLGRAISGDQWHRSATFVDWDFETIWEICEGHFQPFHRWVGWNICSFN